MNKYLILFFVSLCLVVSSCKLCTKKIDCPAFDATVLFDWFPYKQKGQAFYFADTTGDTDTLVIGSIDQTDAYVAQGTSGWGSAGVFCDVHGRIQSQISSLHPHWLALNIDHTQQSDYQGTYFRVRFKNADMNMDVADNVLKGTVGADKNLSSGKYYDAVINGNSYKESIIINTTDTAAANIYRLDKLYLVKGKGIVGYRTYPEQKEYWLQ